MSVVCRIVVRQEVRAPRSQNVVGPSRVTRLIVPQAERDCLTEASQSSRPSERTPLRPSPMLPRTSAAIMSGCTPVESPAAFATSEAAVRAVLEGRVAARLQALLPAGEWGAGPVKANAVHEFENNDNDNEDGQKAEAAALIVWFLAGRDGVEARLRALCASPNAGEGASVLTLEIGMLEALAEPLSALDAVLVVQEMAGAEPDDGLSARRARACGAAIARAFIRGPRAMAAVAARLQTESTAERELDFVSEVTGAVPPAAGCPLFNVEKSLVAEALVELGARGGVAGLDAETDAAAVIAFASGASAEAKFRHAVFSETSSLLRVAGFVLSPESAESDSD